MLRTGALALAVALSAAGCSPGDVALEGKIFDYMGVNSKVKSGDPKVAARTGLILPPTLEKLPEPGSGQEADTALAGLDDPDRKQQVDKVALERKQVEYCKIHYEQAKARGDANADTASGPLGPCRASVFTALEKWNKSE